MGFFSLFFFPYSGHTATHCLLNYLLNVLHCHFYWPLKLMSKNLYLPPSSAQEFRTEPISSPVLGLRVPAGTWTAHTRSSTAQTPACNGAGEGCEGKREETVWQRLQMLELTDALPTGNSYKGWQRTERTWKRDDTRSQDQHLHSGNRGWGYWKQRLGVLRVSPMAWIAAQDIFHSSFPALADLGNLTVLRCDARF